MKMTLIRVSKVFLFSWLFLVTSCGDNLFESTHEKTAKEKAKTLLADGDCAAAQTELSSYLADSPDDSEAVSMYSVAVLQCTEIDSVSVITSGAEGFDKLIASMPEGTQENVDKLQSALDALKSIPDSQRTSEQNYQIAVVSASLAATTAKLVATDENGKYDAQKASTMTEAQATSIISAVETSTEALQASGANDSQVEALNKVQSGISSASGSTNKEKLSDYLHNNAK